MRSREQPLSTSVVPSTEFQSPGRSAPAAICAAQPSVMPAITGVAGGQAGAFGGGGADLAEAGAGRDDVGQQPAGQIVGELRREALGCGVVARLERVACVRRYGMAGEAACDHVGLVGEARIPPARGGGLVLEQPVQLGQRPRGRQAQPPGLLAGAGVVVHERGRQRLAGAADEQDRARRRAGGDGPDRCAAMSASAPRQAAAAAIPPAARVLLVAVAVAAAAQRRRAAAEDRAVVADGDARTPPVPRSRPTKTGPAALIAAAARRVRRRLCRRDVRAEPQLPPGHVAPGARLPADVAERADVLEAQRAVQADARVVGERDAGADAAIALAAQQR